MKKIKKKHLISCNDWDDKNKREAFDIMKWVKRNIWYSEMNEMKKTNKRETFDILQLLCETPTQQCFYHTSSQVEILAMKVFLHLFWNLEGEKKGRQAGNIWFFMQL